MSDLSEWMHLDVDRFGESRFREGTV